MVERSASGFSTFAIFSAWRGMARSAQASTKVTASKESEASTKGMRASTSRSSVVR